MRLIPMSVSELAWDLFYEPEALGHYRQWTASGAQATVRQIWCRVDLSWERAARTVGKKWAAAPSESGSRQPIWEDRSSPTFLPTSHPTYSFYPTLGIDCRS